MKTTLLSLTTFFAFIGSYFFNLTADNFEQYLAVTGVVFLDGFFGVWAGTKIEGFETRKAIKVLKTFFVWILILTVILMIEKGFQGTFWLSETIVAPFITFQIVSVVKNAERAGFIKNELLTLILEKIDQHKTK